MQSRGVARPDDCIGKWRSPAPAGVARRPCVSEERSVRAQQGARSTTKQRPARARFGASPLASGARRRSRVTGCGCGSPRAVLSPSCGQGVGDGRADSRGVLALPTSPSAGLRPIRRRPSGPSSDRASMLGRSGDSLTQQSQLLERRPSARSSRAASTARQPGRGRKVRVATGSIRDDLAWPTLTDNEKTVTVEHVCGSSAETAARACQRSRACSCSGSVPRSGRPSPVPFAVCDAFPAVAAASAGARSSITLLAHKPSRCGPRRVRLLRLPTAPLIRAQIATRPARSLGQGIGIICIYRAGCSRPYREPVGGSSHGSVGLPGRESVCESACERAGLLQVV